jgi:hypothetical protein
MTSPVASGGYILRRARPESGYIWKSDKQKLDERRKTMCTTSHTLQNQGGSEEHVTVAHSREAAVQYDFYIPTVIWDTPPVQTFFTRLLSLALGATVFNGLTGVWQGEPEQTRVYRLILRANQFQESSVTDDLRQEIGVLMAGLTLTPQHQQDFMFTETEIKMNMAS